MKFYDFERLQEIVKYELSHNRNAVKRIVFGMAEDFEDTCEVIYDKDKGVDRFKDLNYDDTSIKIKSSYYDTPIVRIYYSEEYFKELTVYIKGDPDYYAD